MEADDRDPLVGPQEPARRLPGLSPAQESAVLALASGRRPARRPESELDKRLRALHAPLRRA